uniref:acyl-CoA thioesterase n=1 Tax=Rhodococcus qingshengii TaxID=334542 RepID=UPI0027E32AD3|nr:hotdog domain-containing protein [Rhodococcus qingshengii]
MDSARCGFACNSCTLKSGSRCGPPLQVQDALLQAEIVSLAEAAGSTGGPRTDQIQLVRTLNADSTLSLLNRHQHKLFHALATAEKLTRGHIIEYQRKTYEVGLRWRDLDNQGHVYHGTTLTLLDEARTQWFSRIVGGTRPESYVVARIEIDYRSQLVHDDLCVVVDIVVVRVGTTSIALRETMHSKRSGSLIAEALTTVVLWHRDEARPRRITDEESERLETCRLQHRSVDRNRMT